LLAWLGARRGDPDLGLAHASKAIAVSSEAYRRAFALGILGTVHLERDEPGEALRVLEHAVQQADEYRSAQVRAWFRSLLAEGNRRAGRIDDAQSMATEGRALASETHFRWGVALAAQVLGRTDLSIGRHAGARTLLEEALRGFTDIDAAWDIATVRAELALLARIEGHAADAEAGLAEAMARFRRLGVHGADARVERFARTLGVSAASC
jgi:tetratricopeptide (TPR) repeat protein